MHFTDQALNSRYFVGEMTDHNFVILIVGFDRLLAFCDKMISTTIMNCQSNSTSSKRMKSTKVQTLCAIWLKYWNIWIDNTFACYVLGQWFLTLLEVLNPTSSIHAFIEPSMRRPTKAQTEKRHKETAAANVTNMCLRPLNGGARVPIISLRPRQS